MLTSTILGQEVKGFESDIWNDLSQRETVEFGSKTV